MLVDFRLIRDDKLVGTFGSVDAAKSAAQASVGKKPILWSWSEDPWNGVWFDGKVKSSDAPDVRFEILRVEVEPTRLS